MKKLTLFIALVCAVLSCAPQKDVNQQLAEQAAAEYLTPVHAGGENRPFWNGFATKFIYAPSFDFKAPQPSSQVPPALAHQRGRSFLLCCLGLSSPALSAPDTLLCPHLGHVPSHDTGNFVTTCKRACLSKLLGSSKRKQPQFIGNQPKSLGSPFSGGETGWVCVFSLPVPLP